MHIHLWAGMSMHVVLRISRRLLLGATQHLGRKFLVAFLLLGAHKPVGLGGSSVVIHSLPTEPFASRIPVAASPSKNHPCNVCFVCANPEMSCVSANLLLVLRTYTKSNLSAPYLASRDPFVFRGGLAPQKRSLAQTRLDSCGRMVPKVPFPPLARPCRDTPALSLSDKDHQTSIPKTISRKRSCPARLHISGKPPSP